MNFTEQKNYIIAVFVSLIIHFSLLTIHLPSVPASEKPTLETVNVGLVEISSENKSRRISVALNLKEKAQPDQGKKEIKTTVKPRQPSTDTDVLPEEDEVVASDTTAKNAEDQSEPSGDMEEATGSEDSITNEPKSFGTGEAMVKIIGPMPTYPPAVLKEGKEGEAALRILVNADGQLELVIVIKSSGDIRLDYAATSSVEREWKFTSINEGYYIDLTFSFDISIGASVKFVASKTRS